MARVVQVKTNFTAGEVSRDLLGRGDLRAYENGALELRNVFIRPTGGVVRRAGLRHVAMAAGEGRMIAFEFNTEQTYLLVMSAYRIDIYLAGVWQAFLTTPWSDVHIPHVCWTQSADTLLMVHPDVPPRKITRNPGGVWAIEDWGFLTSSWINTMPYSKFAAADVTVTPSATTGTFTVTASAPAFVAQHLYTRLRIRGKEVLINAVLSATQLTVTAIAGQVLPDVSATMDWEEQVFTEVRGYPATVAFHQDRLVIGGTRDLPNRLWFSRTGNLFNFDPGTGLDDEAIEFSILSDQVNAIRGLFAGRHLQVFTSGGEWMVTGDPLTPSTVQLKRQTRVGSATERSIPPVDVDGATLFVSRARQEVREFLYTDVEQAYQATDLALLSRSVTQGLVDQDYDRVRRLLFVAREDGRFATLTVFRAEQVAAWTLHETDGDVLSVAVVGEDVYLLVRRGSGDVRIEQLDEMLGLDAAASGSSVVAQTAWSGLAHLEGRTVRVLADGVRIETHVVTGGAVVLAEPALSVQIGLPFTHVIAPLPPNGVGSAVGARRVRLVEVVFRLEGARAALRLDTGQGMTVIALPDAAFSGDLRVRAMGWTRDLTRALWRIEQDDPRAFGLLAVTQDMIVN